MALAGFIRTSVAKEKRGPKGLHRPSRPDKSSGGAHMRPEMLHQQRASCAVTRPPTPLEQGSTARGHGQGEGKHRDNPPMAPAPSPHPVPPCSSQDAPKGDGVGAGLAPLAHQEGSVPRHPHQHVLGLGAGEVGVVPPLGRRGGAGCWSPCTRQGSQHAAPLPPHPLKGCLGPRGVLSLHRDSQLWERRSCCDTGEWGGDHRAPTGTAGRPGRASHGVPAATDTTRPTRTRAHSLLSWALV